MIHRRCKHYDVTYSGSDPHMPTRCACDDCGQVWVLTDRCTHDHPSGRPADYTTTRKPRYHWCPVNAV